jgi:hypothetical protein
MNNHFARMVLVLLMVMCSFVNARPFEIAMPAFSLSQNTDPQAAKFAEKLGALLAQKSGYTIYQQAKLAAKLSSHVLAKIDIEDPKTLSEAGSAAGVEYVLAGKIDQVGSRIFLTGKMVRVSDNYVLLEISEIVIGGIDLLEERIPGIVTRLCAAIPVAPRTSNKEAAIVPTAARDSTAHSQLVTEKDAALASLKGKIGDLYITTAEDNAIVEMDGKTLEGTSPLTLKNIPAGPHKIKAQKGGRVGSKEIFLKPDDLLKVSIPMALGKGTLKVFSEPSGAVARIDGKIVGQTPVKLDSVAAGARQMWIAKPSYFTIKQAIAVEINKTMELTDTLKPCAYLTVEPSVKSATITVNDVQYPLQALARMEIAVGKTRIRVEAEGYQTYYDSCTLVRGEEKQVKVKLVSMSRLAKAETPKRPLPAKDSVQHVESAQEKEVLLASVQGRTGDLYISTVEDTARIELDGVPLEGTTPLTLKSIPAGPHRIRVQKGGNFGFQDVFLKPDDLAKILIPMTPGRGKLKVFSEPSGAIARIDGKTIGQTPLKFDSVTAGPHHLFITKPSYLTIKQDLAVDIDSMVEVNDTLKPCAYLTIETPSMNATIFVNDAQHPLQTLSRLEVPVGDVRIRAEAEGYQAFYDSFTVVMGEEKQRKIKLVSKFGVLKIKSRPAKANIFLNDNPAGLTDTTMRVPALQKYSIRLEKETYVPQAFDLSVVNDSTTIVSIALRHTQTFEDSAEMVLNKRLKTFQTARRLFFGALAIGCGGAGLYYDTRLKQAANVYNSDKSNNLSSYDAEWKFVKKRESERNIVSYISGVCALGFLISIPF